MLPVGERSDDVTCCFCKREIAEGVQRKRPLNSWMTIVRFASTQNYFVCESKGECRTAFKRLKEEGESLEQEGLALALAKRCRRDASIDAAGARFHAAMPMPAPTPVVAARLVPTVVAETLPTPAPKPPSLFDCLRTKGYWQESARKLLESNELSWSQCANYKASDPVFDSTDESGFPQPHAPRFDAHGGASEWCNKDGKPRAYRFQGPANGSRPWQVNITSSIVHFLETHHGMVDSNGKSKPYKYCQKMTSKAGGPEQPKHADSAPRGHLR